MHEGRHRREHRRRRGIVHERLARDEAAAFDDGGKRTPMGKRGKTLAHDCVTASALALPALAASIARHTRCGVAGMSKCRTPAWRSASSTAFMRQGMDPVTPASPTPLAPSGLVFVGTG